MKPRKGAKADSAEDPAEDPVEGPARGPAEDGEAAPEETAEAPEPGQAEAEAEHRRLFDQLLRLKAEFENYRKRVDRDKPALIRHGKRELLEKLIPLYDVLLTAHEQVLRHAEAEQVNGAAGEDDWDPTAKELVRGLEMIFKEFTRFFEAEGVAVIEAIGQPYDFNRHEVMGQVETDESPEGVVVDVIQRGYLLESRTLRPAKVRVAKAKRK